MTDPRQVSPQRATVAPSTDESRLGDPLKFCIMTTVSLLGWLLGPVAVLVFSGMAIVGYTQARRAGLLRSKCLLGDTRLVLAYLGLLAALAVGDLGLRLTQGGWNPL